MSKFRNAVLTVSLLALAGVASAQSPNYPGVGRAATPKEVAKWDIDVRPDFKGLPAGSGSVAKGQDVWEGKCAHCHGVFGESGEVFSPLIGGTTAEDIKNGRVANLNRSDYPGRTTIMKVATVSTLWDYINRAMPWTAPKSLSTEEVYAVTAFLLNLANVVPDNYVLSDKNIAEVQARMPNRNGMTTQHAMWPGNEFGGVKKPDTNNTLCMKDCKPEAKVASFLPDFARNAHGNLAEQNRMVGQQVGADTTKPEAKAGMPVAAAPVAAATAKPENAEAKAAIALLNKYSCTCLLYTSPSPRD
jgi:mono/diheme cytochrome c family protein